MQSSRSSFLFSRSGLFFPRQASRHFCGQGMHARRHSLLALWRNCRGRLDRVPLPRTREQVRKRNASEQRASVATPGREEAYLVGPSYRRRCHGYLGERGGTGSIDRYGGSTPSLCRVVDPSGLRRCDTMDRYAEVGRKFPPGG